MSETLQGHRPGVRQRLEALQGGLRALSAVRLALTLKSCVVAERERWFLWVPVLLGLGIALYFALPFEPGLVWGLAPALVCGAGLFLAVRFRPDVEALVLGLIAFFCVGLGFASINLRSAMVAAPVLERSWTGEITGRVISTTLTETNFSLLMEPLVMSRLEASQLPKRVRFAIRVKDADASPGEIVRLRGHLDPPPAPVAPGAFDYARAVWFERLGATGFAYTAPEIISHPVGSEALTERLRDKITDRIRGQIGGSAGAIAAALVTGDQRSIPEEAIVALRNAGLAHVLSISGLHMMLFGGSLFWLVRALLSLIPAIALRYPIKKWGAAAALVGASFYLLISGAEVAAQRAYIMLALMFIAVLFDKPAISLRNVALAAIFTLLWRPESLIGASFQMSFGAVTALVAFYEAPRVRELSAWLRGRQGWHAIFFWVLAYLVGLALTSLVAGAATGPVAAFHFNRIAVYGLLGNMVALPVVGAIVMPAALFALVLMPFGLDGPALWLMGQGIDAMLYAAREVSALPGAAALAPSAPFAVLLLFVFGGLWLCLWQRRWRYLGLVPMLLALLFWGAKERADVLIERDGILAAVRTSEGHLALTRRTPSYAAERWLLHEGDDRSPKEAAVSDMISCDREGCVYHEKGRPLIAFSHTLAGLAEDCRQAEIIIAIIPVPRRLSQTCQARLVIDKFDLWRNGAMSLRFGGDEIMIASSREMRGERPWAKDPARRRDQ